MLRGSWLSLELVLGLLVSGDISFCGKTGDEILTWSVQKTRMRTRPSVPGERMDVVVPNSRSASRDDVF